MSTTPARRKPGRQTVFTPATRRRLIKCIAAGVPTTHAASACGVSFSAFCEFRNRNKRFDEAIERAKSRAIERHLNLIIKAAENGDVSSSRWFLERCHSSHFGRQKIELTGADGAPLTAAIGIYLPEKNGMMDPKALTSLATPLIENENPHE